VVHVKRVPTPCRRLLVNRISLASAIQST
jgi:hypothetical protein